ncbi:hypothetical protein SRHO_G00032770 [Serrasalmus rhombeus]
MSSLVDTPETDLFITSETGTHLPQCFLRLRLQKRRIPSRKQKEKYALGIITLFPPLKGPFSPKGCIDRQTQSVHFFWSQHFHWAPVLV